MRKILSMCVGLVGMVALGGCNALDSIGSNGNSISGTYELRTVNGRNLPAVLYTEPGYRLEVLNANFTLSSNGTYSEAGIVREVVNGIASTSSNSTNGYYEYFNGEITFEDNDGRIFYGSADRNTLVVEDDGVTLIYNRY